MSEANKNPPILRGNHFVATSHLGAQVVLLIGNQRRAVNKPA